MDAIHWKSNKGGGVREGEVESIICTIKVVRGNYAVLKASAKKFVDGISGYKFVLLGPLSYQKIHSIAKVVGTC